MSAPEDREPDPTSDAAGRRRFLKQAGALVAAAPVAMALHAAVAAEAAPARKPRAKARPAAPAAADPFAAARPDLSITRTAEERATLERQWKGLVGLLQVIRDAPLDPATEPATIFAALPRIRRRDRED